MLFDTAMIFIRLPKDQNKTKQNYAHIIYFVGLDYDNTEEDKACNAEVERATRKQLDHPAHVSKLKQSTVTNIYWTVPENHVKKDGMSLTSPTKIYTCSSVTKDK